MTAKTLTTVTQNLITTYGNTARNVVHAYRQGNVRAAGYLDQSWAAAVEKAGPRIGANLRQNAVQAQKALSSYYVRGITLGSERADSMVGRVVDLAVRGVDQVAANASRFEQATGLKALSTLAQVAVPAATTVVQVAQRVEAQSETLVNKLAGTASGLAAAPRSAKRKVAKPVATKRSTAKARAVSAAAKKPRAARKAA